METKRFEVKSPVVNGEAIYRDGCVYFDMYALPTKLMHRCVSAVNKFWDVSVEKLYVRSDQVNFQFGSNDPAERMIRAIDQLIHDIEDKDAAFFRYTFADGFDMPAEVRPSGSIPSPEINAKRET